MDAIGADLNHKVNDLLAVPLCCLLQVLYPQLLRVGALGCELVQGPVFQAVLVGEVVDLYLLKALLKFINAVPDVVYE